MADITNAEAVTFSNEKIRTAANKLNSAYKAAYEVVAEWTANGGGEMIPNTSDAVIDGSSTDGRHPITGIHANNIINRLSELKADYEANGAAKLNTILQVATNDKV